MHRNTIVYTVDGNEQALKWLDVSLCSLRKCLGDDVRVVICTDSPRDFGYGTECVDVRGIIEKYGISRISKLEWYGKPVPPMQIFRLALPVVPELADTDKIVFVDADTEFIDKRWAEVFDYDCELVAGVKDGGNKNDFIESRYRDFKRTQRVLSDVSAETLASIGRGLYVNGGVLVMRLDAIRREWNYGASFLPWVIDFCVDAQLRYLDQDIINLFFRPSMIPSRFNNSQHLHKPGEPAYLEHYTGKEKWKSKVYPPVSYQLLDSHITEEQPDIVYTVGKPSEHDDQELRWSLRSIAKYGLNYGRIIVTSPVERDWLSDEVIQVDSQDLPNVGYKHHNILKAILDTIDVLDLRKTFFVSSDDHFYVKHVDFACQPLMAQHWVIPQNMGASNNVATMLWKTSCSDTREFLYNHGMPTIDFQMHRNSKWHGGLVRENKTLFHEAMRLRFCVEPHVLMQNLWVHTQPNARVEFRKDSKIMEFHGIENGCDCISCYDQTFLDDGFMEFMNREFGEKCRYERG